ncbi:MAG: hypothetical protein ACP5QK_04385 [Myxococcota bacterium]
MQKIFIVLSLLFLFISCFVDTELAPCISSENCPKGQFCSKTDMKCHKTEFRIYSCEDSGCKENEFCYPLDNSCHLKDEVGLPCETYNDCPSGQLCKENHCNIPAEPQCKEDSECIKENVNTARCDEGVCKIDKCNLGFSDKDMDFSNGCENILPCTDEGFNNYEQCTGNNVCKCDSDCIKLSGYYGVDYNKGLCLKKCSPTDVNKSFDNMLCACTANEMGICKKANLFETAMLSGLVRARMVDNCDDFMKDSTTFRDISLTLGGVESTYNRATACKKTENGKPIINVSLFKVCQLLPCKDIVVITLPQDIKPNQTLTTDDAGALKATVNYSLVDNKIQVQDIWFNAMSVAGSIIVNNNGLDQSKIIELNINLKMMRYDVPFCGDIVKKSCSGL